MKLRFFVCSVIFAAGVLVGRLSWGTRSEPRVTPVEAVSSADYAIAVPQVEVPSDGPMDRAMDGKEKLPGDLPNPEADPEPKGSGENLELVRRMSELQKSGLLNFSVPAFDDKKHITKALKQMLQITDSEEAALNLVMDETDAKIRAVEWGSTATRTEGKNVILTIPAYPADGGKIYDEALGRLSTIIGGERSELFQEIGRFESVFNGFGINDREITMAPFSNGKSTGISLTDKSQNARGSGSSTSVFSDRAAVIKQLGTGSENRVPAELPK